MQNAGSPSIATLFVYGTLLRAFGHPMGKRLQSQSRYLGAGSIEGKLYRLGWFPGVVETADPRDRVFGEVFRLVNPDRGFAWIDDYEGCGPRHPEPLPYQRVIAPVTMDSGDKVPAWVYVYKGAVSRARLIPDGRFLPIRAERP